MEGNGPSLRKIPLSLLCSPPAPCRARAWERAEGEHGAATPTPGEDMARLSTRLQRGPLCMGRAAIHGTRDSRRYPGGRKDSRQPLRLPQRPRPRLTAEGGGEQKKQPLATDASGCLVPVKSPVHTQLLPEAESTPCWILCELTQLRERAGKKRAPEGRGRAAMMGCKVEGKVACPRKASAFTELAASLSSSPGSIC